MRSPTTPTEEIWEELYHGAPCGYFSTAPNGLITRANRTFAAWIGQELDELVGEARFQDLVSTGGRIFYETHIAPLLSMQGAVRELAVDITRSGRDPLPALVNATATVVSGAHVETRWTVFDATDRREYERELLRERKRAEESEANVRALQATTAELVSATNDVEILSSLVGAGRARFGASSCEAWLLTDDRSGLARRAHSGPAPKGPGFHNIGATASTNHMRALTMSDALVCSPSADRTIILCALDGMAMPQGVMTFEYATEVEEVHTATLRTLTRVGGQALERSRSHWLLRRVQEVLPICMDCEDIRPEDDWMSIIDYFKANSLEVSHGLCPTCLTRRLKDPPIEDRGG